MLMIRSPPFGHIVKSELVEYGMWVYLVLCGYLVLMRGESSRVGLLGLRFVLCVLSVD